MGEGAKGPIQSFVMRFTKSGHIVTLHLPAREAYSGQPSGGPALTTTHTSLAFPMCHLHVQAFAHAPLSFQDNHV